MYCPVCGRLEYDCECEPSEPIPEIGGEDEADMSWYGDSIEDALSGRYFQNELLRGMVT
jgi:hypothetical protein